MKQIGPAIKRIRENKGLTQVKIYDGVMSRTNYARFEDGQIDSSATNLMEMLKRLNLLMTEFANLYDGDTDTAIAVQQQALKLVNQGMTEQRPEPFLKAAALMATQYEDSHYIADHHTQLTLQIYADYMANDGHVVDAAPLLQQLLTYLEKNETWYSYEVSLLNNLMPMMTPNQLLVYLRIYMQRVSKLTQVDPGVASVGEVLVQAFEVAINNRDFEIYQSLLALFDAQHLQERLLFPHLFRQAFDAFAAYTQDQDAAALQGKIDPLLLLVSTLQIPVNGAQLRQDIARLQAWLAPNVKFCDPAD
ncbi:Rgg/GadR/MutR family transcriptional regulator [Lacticaseibacillus yichunensis]|uniref:HTH cro/C1-type domain-containing protein n=1 Tax=Lacticaseibacillus yichunensis TaxID=2486015 RepID=A0ABW4CSY7_9LACO|nr:Rgg/GadR/MutR family transcriptional regulator [Lacticaseibacillus yichunensis]